MRCDTCDNGERVPARKARLGEKDGRTAVVTDVPVEVCPACGEVWLDIETAKQLDELFTRMLASGAETSQMRWPTTQAA
jgi:YgiT-type zinc finger domain-containing protein